MRGILISLMLLLLAACVPPTITPTEPVIETPPLIITQQPTDTATAVPTPSARTAPFSAMSSPNVNS